MFDNIIFAAILITAVVLIVVLVRRLRQEPETTSTVLPEGAAAGASPHPLDPSNFAYPEESSPATKPKRRKGPLIFEDGDSVDSSGQRLTVDARLVNPLDSQRIPDGHRRVSPRRATQVRPLKKPGEALLGTGAGYRKVEKDEPPVSDEPLRPRNPLPHEEEAQGPRYTPPTVDLLPPEPLFFSEDGYGTPVPVPRETGDDIVVPFNPEADEDERPDRVTLSAPISVAQGGDEPAEERTQRFSAHLRAHGLPGARKKTKGDS